MKVRLNTRKQVKLNKGDVKANLFNEVRVKLPGVPGSSSSGGGGKIFDYTFDFTFE